MDGKDIATGLMSNPLDLKEIFYSNLLLLGFDSQAEETNYRIPLNRDMFNYPNKKAMEIVCHFLFCRLDPQLAFQEFRDCWRIQDKKTEQQFRKSCTSWLSKIYKEEPDSNLPRIGPSLFLSPGGDRFYELMFYFSSFVLQKVMARDHGKHGSVPYVCKKTAKNPTMTRTSSKATTARTVSEKDRFFKDVQHHLEVQDRWKSHAASTTKEHRKLSKENRELERRLNPKGIASSHTKDKNTFEEEAETLRRTKKLQEVRELWSKFETFYHSSKEKRNVLNEILEGHEETFCIHGSEIQLQIPEALTMEYKHYIQMKNIGNTYQAGKLNLLSVIQLSSLALHQLKERIKEDGIQGFEKFAPFIKNEVHGHAAHLANAQNLRSALVNEVIPELKKSIDNLKEECYALLDERTNSPIVALESFNFGLGLLPTTPSPAFAAADQPICSSEIPENSLRQTPRNEDTPDVVQSLTRSIREMVVWDTSQELDATKFDGNHISERSVEGSEAPKPFFSKIPKPVKRRLSQTPDGLSRRPRAVSKRMTASTTKKLKKHVMAHNVATPTATSMKNASVTTGKVSIATEESSMQGRRGARTKLFPGVAQKDVMCDQTTPLRTGLKSALKRNPSAARHILAEKIAKAVFADEPTVCVGNSSSPSSSGENTPKDIGVADPVANLGEEPFTSKDLIPRTPFKADTYSDLAQDELGNGVEVLEEVEDNDQSPLISTRIAFQDRPSSPSQLSTHNNVGTPFNDSLGEYDDILSPAGSPSDPLFLSTHDSGSASPSTPEATQLISMSWKTPAFATSQGTPTSTYSYTPIDSKLTVVDINTPYAVTPGRTRSLDQPGSLSDRGMPKSTRQDILDAQTVVDLTNVQESRDSPLLRDRFSPVSPTTSDGARFEDRNLKSDTFSGAALRRTAFEDGISLLDSRLFSTKASISVHSPPEPSEPRSSYAVSNVEGRADSRIPLNGSTNTGGVDKRFATSFKVHDGLLPISHPSKAGVLVPTTTSPGSVPAPSAPEKPSLTNELLLRYQRLKKAQEATESIAEDDDVASPPHSPTSFTVTRAFATPGADQFGENDRECIFGETPLLDTVPPMDLNANSLSLDDRERVKSRLFSERTPGSPSLVDTRPFYFDSPPEDGANKSGRASEANNFEGLGLTLTPVEIEDWCTDQLSNSLRRLSVGDNPEDSVRRPSSGTENEQPRQKNNLPIEMINDETLPSTTLGSIEVGRLINFD